MKILTNKFFILGNLILILAAIPLTLFFVKKQQDLQSSAAPSSKLYFQPASVNTQLQCTSFTMDVMVDPGTNQVSTIDLYLTYDPTLVEVTQITPSSTFNIVQREASISNGTASIDLDAVGGSPDPSKYVTSITKVATVTFAPKSAGTATIKFGTDTQVLSLADAEKPYTNVLSSSADGTATIASGACAAGIGVSTTPSLTTSVTPGTGLPITQNVSSTPSPTSTASISASITPVASASPTISIPTPTPTVIIPTATPIPPTPTLVQKPTIAPTGTLAQTFGIVTAVVFAILGGIALLAL